MTTPHQNDREEQDAERFEALAWGYLDGVLPEEDAAVLMKRVALDASAAQRYHAIATLHLQTQSLFSRQLMPGEAPRAMPGEAPRAAMLEAAGGPAALARQPAGAAVRHAGGQRSLKPLHAFLTAAASVAATLLLLAGGGWLSLDARDQGQQAGVGQTRGGQTRGGQTRGGQTRDGQTGAWQTADGADPAGIFAGDGAPLVGRGLPGAAKGKEADATPGGSPYIAATLTGAVDCDWEPGFDARYGEFLAEGREIRLRSGLVQLTFESGAKIVLQGPAAFVADSGMFAQMTRGKISALCPQSARGFRLRTPTAEIIDIGTEFAVAVESTGDSEVHVFKGEVVARSLSSTKPGGSGEPGESGPYTVTENTALRFEQGGRQRRSVRFAGERFVREIQPRLTPAELPDLKVGRSLVLWLAADMLVKVDENGRVLAWRDILFGDNQSPDDATSVIEETRPRHVPTGMNGRPAIRFNGVAYLVTPPITTTNDQTLLVVYKADPSSAGREFQLISYNGPPVRGPINGNQQGLLQLGYLRRAPASKIQRRHEMQGLVYSVRDSVGARHGFVRSAYLPPGEPRLVTFVYGHSTGRASLAVNGGPASIATAPEPAAVTSRKVIGRHGLPRNHFRGSIAEVLIYNSALTESERAEVEGYLKRKYGL
ncbi:MAG: LamG-like jellyroll fold domain-containing protein [Planctomycetota bacterium]